MDGGPSINATGPLAARRLAGAPISWGVCEVPGWGRMLPPGRVLAEMASLGLAAMELGLAVAFAVRDEDTVIVERRQRLAGDLLRPHFFRQRRTEFLQRRRCPVFSSGRIGRRHPKSPGEQER